MSYLDRADQALMQIRSEQQYRAIAPRQPPGAIDFSSNDYLGLAEDARVVQAFTRASRVGSGGARLLGGAHREHTLLEEELAAWLGRERALLFSSGYHAALGAIGTLAPLVDCIYSDQLNHAALIDGMRSVRTPRHVFAHRQSPPRSARASRGLIVTESIFSMDGDAAELRAIFETLTDDDVLLVDEAHALGVAGVQGAGLAQTLADPRIVVMGTLSKSLGGLGGFIAGPNAVIELMINTARTFVFDTALPPAIVLAARIALSIARSDEELRTTLRANVARLRAGLRAMGLPGADSPSPIVPIILGDSARALSVAAALLERQIYAPAVRPPTVPPGTSRLRLSVRANHSAQEIDLCLRHLESCIGTS